MNANDFKAYRNSLGLTQTQMAQKLGYSSASIGNWEQGKFRIPKKVVDFINGEMSYKQHSLALITKKIKITPQEKEEVFSDGAERDDITNPSVNTDKVLWVNKGYKHEIASGLLIVRDSLSQVVAVIE